MTRCYWPDTHKQCCDPHQACGRLENQHAIKHYETPRSEPHCLVLSLDVWSVWSVTHIHILTEVAGFVFSDLLPSAPMCCRCYICDDEVQYSSTGQLAQLITNIRKQVLTDPDKKTSNKSRCFRLISTYLILVVVHQYVFFF